MHTSIIILSGIAGSGKSTYIKKHASEASVICSADHFFMQDGEYCFDPRKLGEAHAACLRKFADELATLAADPNLCCDFIFVDNTNLTAIEMAPYVQLAAAYKCPVEIVTLHCNVDIAAHRNIHGVPRAGIERMHQTLQQRDIPPYWNVKLTPYINS